MALLPSPAGAVNLRDVLNLKGVVIEAPIQ
jgi:hypothetical protein